MSWHRLRKPGLHIRRIPLTKSDSIGCVRLRARLLRHAGQADFEWPAEIGYATPKVDVRGAVFRNGEVLLIKEASSGKWTLPGGWADVNLTPAENVEKECLEESGYEVKARLITAIVDRVAPATRPTHMRSTKSSFFAISAAARRA